MFEQKSCNKDVKDLWEWFLYHNFGIVQTQLLSTVASSICSRRQFYQFTPEQPLLHSRYLAKVLIRCYNPEQQCCQFALIFSAKSSFQPFFISLLRPSPPATTPKTRAFPLRIHIQTFRKRSISAHVRLLAIRHAVLRTSVKTGTDRFAAQPVPRV